MKHAHRNTSTRNKRRTPYCKVCHDAGKSLAEYTSHYVKDRPGPTGKVVCPYLLSLKCRYCHETGHTPNHCPHAHGKKMSSSHHRHRCPTKTGTADQNGWVIKTPTRRPKKHHCNAPKRPNRRKAKKNQFEKLYVDDDEENHHFPKMMLPPSARKEENIPDPRVEVSPEIVSFEDAEAPESEDRFKGMSWYDIVIAEEAEEEEERKKMLCM